MKRLLVCLLCLFLALPALAEEGEKGLPLQPCHRFEVINTETKQRNGAIMSLWQIDTVCDVVDEELNALARAWAEEIAPTLPAPKTTSSRVNVIIRPSRTGLSWMSFMVQSRIIGEQQTRGVRFTTRTYDMLTGQRIMLGDIFPADSEAWGVLADAVRDGVNLYFPEREADAERLDWITGREQLEQLDFTLHGMSLVLHLHAADFYPGREQLLEIPLYYPQLRPFMTEEAQRQTDNATYYKTIALTVDDGPNAWCTDQMLLAMLRTGVRGTYFLVGNRVRQQAYLVQREHDEGHAIASHNWEHVFANETPAAYLAPMPARVTAVHTEVIGIDVRYARAPGGHWRGMADAGMGWPLIQWTVETQDWDGGESGPNPREMAKNIVAGAEDGGIILMHDLKRNSPPAVELFVRELQEKGYMFLTVDELFAKDGVTLEPDMPYWRCTDGVVTKHLEE